MPAGSPRALPWPRRRRSRARPPRAASGAGARPRGRARRPPPPCGRARGGRPAAVERAERQQRQHKADLDQDRAAERRVDEVRDRIELEQALQDPAGEQRGDAGQGDGREGGPSWPRAAACAPRRRTRASRPAPGGARRRTTKTARKARISTAASAKIAAVGTPPTALGVQVSVPVMAPGRSPTRSGTDQSKTFVRTSGSVTCGGRPSPIQCARWSCHSKRPEREISFHFGGVSASRPSGTSTFAWRSSLR